MQHREEEPVLSIANIRKGSERLQGEKRSSTAQSLSQGTSEQAAAKEISGLADSSVKVAEGAGRL
jgi:hypothetical protein